MSAFSEGTPNWADVSLTDLAAGRRFYGELFGWTFVDHGERFGHYTTAMRDGKNAAALMAKMDPSAPNAWNVYFATPDGARTAAEIKDAGGQVVFGPAEVGDFGVMTGAVDPGGAYFGTWQPGQHRGFDITDRPGAFCWTENLTRDPDAVDTFYDAVFGFGAEQLGDGEHFDYKVWSLPGEPEKKIAGRMKQGDDLPADVPAAFQLYFAVDDCDAAVAAVQRLGGTVSGEPQDSPFGRLAAVADDQGASFVVIDQQRRIGAIPGR
ncbi:MULTISPECIES: VOC family protein [unclassified Streptomyces]|uniref:VOC family protein n=1 Tax=unclassified Streptomyces TaxID=2593676 RepID=UPI002E2D3A2A|nr:VOC family protein [Streptomyces sp. NBC_00223]